ncbi:MAG TPA: DUF1993 domain-containing protein [Bradyrhizobium sp.]
MTSVMQAMAIESFVSGLMSLAGLLDKGAAHARDNRIDLVNARLAPDMYTLAQQVQQACNYAKDGTARLTGRNSARLEAVGKTFVELKADIAKTIEELSAVPAAAFEGAEARDCSIELSGEGIMIAMDGPNFLRGWALPHFYFHLVTAYDILRHNGVAIGKRDYASWVGDFVRPLH